MARTHRKLPPNPCLRRMRNLPHKREQALLIELLSDADLALDCPLKLGNRARLKAVPEPYDDHPISALGETKHLWR